jgi:UDP-2,3-diacylglucosamine hydrolase
MSSSIAATDSEAMFIADLHLHPEMPEITHKFFAFIKWAANKTKTLYILGDFLHAWPGDDAMDEWSDSIANKLSWLSSQGVDIYFMPGNRDFLVSRRFLTSSKMQEISEPSVIKFGDERVLLVHGDRYCTKDRAHQYLRRFTRNSLFKLIFLRTPYKFRARIVSTIRKYSQSAKSKPQKNMQAIPSAITKHLRSLKSNTVVHGHTHQPGLTKHVDNQDDFYQYVLSDWDENPSIMCYNSTKKFHYVLFAEDV